VRSGSLHTHSVNFSLSLRAWAWAANVAGMSTASPPVRSISAFGRRTWMGLALHTDSNSDTASTLAVPYTSVINGDPHCHLGTSIVHVPWV